MAYRGCKSGRKLNLTEKDWDWVYDRLYDPRHLTYKPAPSFLGDVSDCMIFHNNSHKTYSQIKNPKPPYKRYLAHRLSFWYHKGIDPGRKLVMHLCDRPRCINDEHLELGTQSENLKYAERDGLVINPFIKFNYQDYGEMCWLYFHGGYTQVEISKMYSVDKSMIYRHLRQYRELGG